MTGDFESPHSQPTATTADETLRFSIFGPGSRRPTRILQERTV